MAISAPLNCTAVAMTPSQIKVTWTAVSGADLYYVFRSMGGSYTRIATTAATSYTDLSALPCTSYSYRVQACDKCAASDNSNTASVTTATVPLAAPTNVSATLSGDHVNLLWRSVPYATEYRIERRLSTDSVYDSLGTTVFTFATDNGPLSTGVAYCYRIVAVNQCSETPSGYVCVNVPCDSDAPAWINVQWLCP